MSIISERKTELAPMLIARNVGIIDGAIGIYLRILQDSQFNLGWNIDFPDSLPFWNKHHFGNNANGVIGWNQSYILGHMFAAQFTQPEKYYTDGCRIYCQNSHQYQNEIFVQEFFQKI
jgi:hypothetical protein